MDDTAIWPVNVVLQDRDIELFRYLNEQKFMVSGQIYQLFWPESDPRAGTARQRLTKLIESGYVKLLETKYKRTRLRLFLLKEKGIEALRMRGIDHGFSELEDINPVIAEHTLKLVNIRTIFRGLGATNWESERVIRKKYTGRGWYPDAIINVRGLKIAIELENSFRPKERYIKRFGRYEEDREFTLAVFIISWLSVRSWLLELETPQDKVCFLHYDDLMNKKGDAELENKTSKIILHSILS